jgi:hypothetical protein
VDSLYRVRKESGQGAWPVRATGCGGDRELCPGQYEDALYREPERKAGSGERTRKYGRQAESGGSLDLGQNVLQFFQIVNAGLQ